MFIGGVVGVHRHGGVVEMDLHVKMKVGRGGVENVDVGVNMEVGEDEGEYKIVAIVDSKKLIFTPERRFWAR